MKIKDIQQQIESFSMFQNVRKDRKGIISRHDATLLLGFLVATIVDNTEDYINSDVGAEVRETVVNLRKIMKRQENKRNKMVIKRLEEEIINDLAGVNQKRELLENMKAKAKDHV